jgi:hypothetical protein
VGTEEGAAKLAVYQSLHLELQHRGRHQCLQRMKELTLSNLDTTATAHSSAGHAHTRTRRVSTETKASFKTTELVAYVLAVLGVLIAAALVDATDFGAQEAWRYITYLTVGYMISRGLAKSGSRDFYDASADSDLSGR